MDSNQIRDHQKVTNQAKAAPQVDNQINDSLDVLPDITGEFAHDHHSSRLPQVTPQNVIQLQAILGNHKVARMVAEQRATLQRVGDNPDTESSPVAAGKRKPETTASAFELPPRTPSRSSAAPRPRRLPPTTGGHTQLPDLAVTVVELDADAPIADDLDFDAVDTVINGIKSGELPGAIPESETVPESKTKTAQAVAPKKETKLASTKAVYDQAAEAYGQVGDVLEVANASGPALLTLFKKIPAAESAMEAQGSFVSEALKYLPFIGGAISIIIHAKGAFSALERFKTFKSTRESLENKSVLQENEGKKSREFKDPKDAELYASVYYAEKKIERAYFWRLANFYAAFVQLMMHLISALTAAAAAAFTEPIALTVSLVRFLAATGRKIKGFIKLTKGTRGVERTANAQTIYESALNGDPISLKLLVSLKPFSLLDKVKNQGKLAGAAFGAGINPYDPSAAIDAVTNRANQGDMIPTNETEMEAYLKEYPDKKTDLVQEIANAMKST